MTKLFLLVGCAALLIGCSGDKTAQSEKEAEAVVVKTKNASAADNQKNLANANMSPEVKKVLGGGAAGGN